MSLYDVYYESRRFKTLTPQRQREIIDLLKSTKDDYYFGLVMDNVFCEVDKATTIDLFNAYIKHTDSSYGRHSRPFGYILHLRKLDESCARTFIKQTNNHLIQKAILAFDNLTVEEEELGLRALSKSKQVPDQIYNCKYQPSIEALKRLPSIMRLNSLESLTNQRFDSYNIFGRITDADEFKALLFGSVFKHQERAERIWKRYVEMTNVGVPGFIKLSGNCDKCSNFEITINSKVIRTEEGLKKTRIAYSLAKEYCPLCGKRLSQNMSIEGS